MIKFFRFLAVLIALLLIGYLVAPTYLQNALRYYTANIDDYEIFPNRKVEGGNPIPWQLAKNYNQKEIVPEKLEAIKEYNPVAFLVVQNDSLLYEEYWDGYGEDSYSNSFSVAKSIVGLLIGAAIDEGKIKSIDDRVGKYLPNYNEGLDSLLTIKDVLTMSSGLNWDESYSSPFSVTTKAYYGDNLEPIIQDFNIVDVPGKNWNYLSGNTLLLASLIQKTTGKNVSQYASEKLWRPLGAENDALWSLDHENGIEKSYCCFNSNARDFARIGNMVLNKGKFNDRQIISADYLEKMIQPADYLLDEEGKPVNFYGLHWWILNYKGRRIPYARGILGQYIFILEDKDAVVVRLGHERADEYINNHPEEVFLYLDVAYKMLN